MKPCVMPAISRFYGIVIFMNYDDHLPRHFHARYGERKASIRIADGTVLDGSLPGRALRLIEEWRQQHLAELEENWRRYATQQPFLPIAPL